MTYCKPSLNTLLYRKVELDLEAAKVSVPDHAGATLLYIGDGTLFSQHRSMHSISMAHGHESSTAGGW